MFWKKLPKFFTVLAPMEDVTDTVFRQIIAGVGRPDVFFTEFTNVDAICHFLSSRATDGSRGIPPRAMLGRDDMQNPAMHRLSFAPSERPLVAQIWGTDPLKFKKAAEVIKRLGFDGIDINLGCPERKVTKMGACGGMIGQNAQVGEIIAATKEGAGDLPVSVKTRIGNKKIITEDWIGFLLTQNLAALTVHGRTVAEQSLVPAHWDEIGKAVGLRDDYFGGRDTLSRTDTRPPRRYLHSRQLPEVQDSLEGQSQLAAKAAFKVPLPPIHHTLIVGNGDVVSLEDARNKAEEFGVEGVMIGRGIFENPWIFNKSQILNPKLQDKIELLRKHLDLWEKTWGDKKNFAVMKKFVKMYVRDFDGASELRVRLMDCKTAQEMTSMLH